MTESPSDKPPRRPRYRGKNPRHFSEKYKEHAPERFPNDIAKVLASGKTPAGMHRSIMVQEILNCLKPSPGETAVDCTLGYGGHAQELLAAVQPSGRLIGLDVDPLELPRTEARLRGLGFPDESLIVIRSSFAGLNKALMTAQVSGADLILADLGVSSMQIDNPERGFTFKSDGPLDMRMNPARGISAAQLLSQIRPGQLAACLTDNADEPHADFLAERILTAHAASPLQSTSHLADVVRSSYSQIARGQSELVENAVRRVFQALRIAVNDELGALDAMLRQLSGCLNPGGRVAFLSFHSGEDRRVKHHFRDGLRNGIYRSISENMIQATTAERHENPRSASAKLRYAVRSELPVHHQNER